MRKNQKEIAVKSLGTRINGGFEVTLHDDGTLVRKCINPGEPAEYPEHADLKITGYCDAGCAWCHEDSKKSGIHGDAEAIIGLVSQFPKGSELAIGGGNPFAHPKLEYMLQAFAANGIISNITINHFHLNDEMDRIERLSKAGLLFGIGVSADPSSREMTQWRQPNLVHHVIAGIHSPRLVDNLPPESKILVLGYKNYGRGNKFGRINDLHVFDNIKAWRREIAWMVREHVVSFDNLAIEQLNPKRLFFNVNDYESRHMGEEGEFSIYIDGVKREFAKSSYSNERTPWSGTLKDMFNSIRIKKS